MRADEETSGGHPGSSFSLRSLLYAAAFVASYWVLQEVAFALVSGPPWIPLIWPPAGLATAALLLAPRRRWPVYLALTGAAAVAGNYVHGQPHLASWLYGGYNTLVPLAGAVAFLELNDGRARLATTTDLRNLVIGPCLIAPMLTSVLGIAVFVWAGVLPGEELLLQWEHHWVGQGLGVLALVPVALAGRRHVSDLGWSRGTLEPLALVLAIGAGAWWSLRGGSVAVGSGLLLELAPFLLLYWLGARYGTAAGALGATLATGVIVALTMVGTSFELFGAATGEQAVRVLRAILVAIILPTLALGVTVEERTRAQEERARAKEEVAEAREREIERLTELETMRREFVNRAAHELKTPLTPMLFQAKALASGMLGDVSKEQSDSLDVLERNLGRLDELVDDLIISVQLQGGELDLEPGHVDLDELIEEGVDAYRSVAEQRGITLEIAGGDEAPPAWGDRERLARVVAILLDNAIRFTPTGGRVAVRTVVDGDDVGFEVEDTGPGLTEEQAEDAFEPFLQPIDPPSDATPSSGLGLHIARGIVEGHDGAIEHSSPPEGIGSRFTVRIPQASADRAPEAVQQDRSRA